MSASIGACSSSACATARRSEPDHLPYGPPVRQPIERCVEIVETDALAQQAVHRQLALTVQCDVPRDVARGIATAQIAAFDRALLGDDADVWNGEQVLRIGESG